MLSRSESLEKKSMISDHSTADLSSHAFLFGLRVSTLSSARKVDEGSTRSDQSDAERHSSGPVHDYFLDQTDKKTKYFRKSEYSQPNDSFSLSVYPVADRSFERHVNSIKYHWRGTKVNCPGVFSRLSRLDDEIEFVQDFSGKKVYPNHIFKRSAT